jgi:hypothetical protein
VLWDTGAEVSHILSSLLKDDIKRDELGAVQDMGFATATIRYEQLMNPSFPSSDLSFRFTGVEVPHKVESNIMFRPELPNNTTFVILGQHVSTETHASSRHDAYCMTAFLDSVGFNTVLDHTRGFQSNSRSR